MDKNNLLYISHLSNNIAAGLNWSVPASVAAQQKYDNVLWINLTDAQMEHWLNIESYHNYKEFGHKFDIANLPHPFNNPDLVIFEGFYFIDDPLFAKKLIKQNIPYVIIPRSSLTKQALNNKSKWKKRIGHFFLFNKFIHQAAGIQYLTHAELRDSGLKWNSNNIVIPNGFNSPKIVKSVFNESGIKCVFIGRLDFYQKGLDLFIDACSNIAKQLKVANVTVDIYGPRRYDWDIIGQYCKDKNVDNLITINDEIGGTDKRNVLINADVFILPSRFEGHPMGLIEALAYGIPSLVTTGSNMSDEITKYNAGWSCDCSVSGIENALLKMIQDKQKFHMLGKNAQLLAKTYDWDIIAMDTHNKYSVIINKE